MTIFIASMWMTLRISYRTLLSRVRESVPTLSRIRESILPSDIYEDDVTPIKKVKLDDTYRKKSEELERKLANIQKAKTPIKDDKIGISGKSILSNALSGLTKKVPLETPDGKIIESKSKTQSVDFGAWDFPSVKLLNTIEHKNLVSPDEIEEKSILIQKTLLQFGIDVDMEGESV